MKRRDLLLGAAVSTLLAGCGGGGDSAGQPTAQTLKTKPAPLMTTGTAVAATTTTSGSGYPFGSRQVPYSFGIKPSAAASSMDAQLTAGYDAWKAARIVPAPGISNGLADQFSQTQYLTVSEGMGYAMLLAVVFAGHDSGAQKLFDGLLATVRARPAYSIVPYEPLGQYLMDWRINADGSRGDGWSAADGDLDIAMALLMADKQWGSAGAVNYLAEAKNNIAALKAWNFDAATGAVGGRGVSHPGASRTSDYMIGHFRAFQAATGDTFWQKAIDKALFNLDYIQTNFSPATGLIPDWLANGNTATPAPSPGYIGDGIAQEGDYWWNACRDPWRLGCDYVLSGDAKVKTILGRLTAFFAAQVAAADIFTIGTGYDLKGTKLGGGNDAAFMDPILVGAMSDAQYQGLVDSLWNWNTGRMVTGYFDSEIQLLSLVAASGNWWTTGAQAAAASQPSTTQQQTTSSSPSSPSSTCPVAAAWDASVRYMPGDRVTRLGKVYVATAVCATVWNVDSPPEWTPSYWSLATLPAAWNTTTRYMAGAKVTRLGKYYVALPISNTAWNVNSPPEWTPTYWGPTCP